MQSTFVLLTLKLSNIISSKEIEKWKIKNNTIFFNTLSFNNDEPKVYILGYLTISKTVFESGLYANY